MGDAAARAEALLGRLGLFSNEVNATDDGGACFRVACPADAAEQAALIRRIRAADWAAGVRQVRGRLDPNEPQLLVTVPDRRTRWRRGFAWLLVFGLLLMALALGGLYALIWVSGFHDPGAEWALQLDRARAHALRAARARWGPAPE